MQSTTPRNTLHLLLTVAAVAVTAVSALGAVVLVINQVSARHVAAPEAAVAAALPAAPDEAAAPPAPQSAPRVAGNPRQAMPPVTAAEPAPPINARGAACPGCGTVTSLRVIKTPGQGSGVGAVAGGVLGGVVGNQFGRGNGRDATRILGAIGGAVAGHQIEKQARTSTHFEVTVRMEDGSLRALTRSADPGVKAGDRIRLDGDQIRAADGTAIMLRPALHYAPDKGDA